METYFIIVGWNNLDLLDQCFTSIYNQTYTNYRIVYVDNGSTDGSAAWVKDNHPTVILVDHKTNNGFAIGNNIGIAKALEDPECQYVALLNTDATIDSDWLQTLIDFCKAHPGTASVQTPTLDYYDHNILDSRGIKIDKAGRAIQLGYREKATKKYRSTKIFGVNAAACVYTSDFLKSQPFGTDFFDSDLWMYLEDVDLAARANILGYSNWLVEGSRAYHMGSASSSKNPGFSVYYIYRNNSLMLLKNFSLIQFISMVPAIVISDFFVLISTARGRNWLILRKIIKGRLHSLRLFGLFLKKSNILQQKRKISNRDLRELMSAH